MGKKISQRKKDFTYISELCKYSEIYVKNSTCPLILKRCNNENCPLFFCVNIHDCDVTADIVADNNRIY